MATESDASGVRGLPWALLGLVGVRLALRDRPASRRVRRVQLAAAAVTLASATALLLGLSQLWLVVVLAPASMVLLATAALRMFPPAMAVSVVGIALSCASMMTALAVTSGFLNEVSITVSRFNGHILLTKYGLDFTEYETLGAEIAADPRVAAISPFAYSMVVVVRDDAEAAGSAAALPTAPSIELATDMAPSTDVDAAWDAALDADLRLSASPPPNAGPRPSPQDTATADDRGPARASTDHGADRPAIVVGKGIDPQQASEFSALARAFGRGDLSGLRPADSRHLPGVVLGHALRRALGVEIGGRVRVVVPAELDGRGDATTAMPRHATFEVLDELQTGVVELDRNLVLMHLTAAQALFFRKGRVTGIELELRDPTSAQTVAADLAARLPELYRVSTWYEANAEMLKALTQIRVVVAIVLGLMGVVGASSLVASLLLVVRRKHHDIGVLLAVGSDHRTMFWIFEGVGLFAGAVGVVLGTALGTLYCLVIGAYRFPLEGDVYPIDHLPAQIAAADAIIPGAIAMVLCACASGPVALLAARVRILTALARG